MSEEYNPASHDMHVGTQSLCNALFVCILTFSIKYYGNVPRRFFIEGCRGSMLLQLSESQLKQELVRTVSCEPCRPGPAPGLPPAGAAAGEGAAAAAPGPQQPHRRHPERHRLAAGGAAPGPVGQPAHRRRAVHAHHRQGRLPGLAVRVGSCAAE